MVTKTRKKVVAKKVVRNRLTKADREAAYSNTQGACSYCDKKLNPFSAFKVLTDADDKGRPLCSDCSAIAGAGNMPYEAFVTKIENLRVKSIALLERYPSK